MGGGAGRHIPTTIIMKDQRKFKLRFGLYENEASKQLL